MSLIIEDEFFTFTLSQTHKTKHNLSLSQSILSKFPYQSQIRNRAFDVIAYYEFRRFSKKYFKLIIAFKKKLFNTLDIWYVATLDDSAICVQEKLIIAKDQMAYKISSFKKKYLALKQIYRNKIGEPRYSKIYITEQGIIQILVPKLILNTNLATSLRCGIRSIAKNQVFSQYIQNLVAFIITDSKETLKNIFNTLTDIAIKQDNITKQVQKQNQLRNMKFQLYRYLVRSPVQLRFDCTQGSALYQQVVDITITEQKQIQDRINYIKYANQLKLKSLDIYLQSQFIFQNKQRQAFYMTAKQKQMTKNLLEIPQIIPQKTIQQGGGNIVLQNKYMFNNIVLELPRQQEPLVLLAESGFGRIQYGTFSFWYLMNPKLDKQQMEETLKQSNKIKKKYLIVKSPKPASDQQNLQKYLTKQMHEIKIINMLKGLSCALIPRFYQVQKFYPEPFTQLHKQYIKKYQHALLGQLTSCYGQPGYNIGHLIEQRWHTLSLKKIVYIMSQVAQALRFLHMNKIVHLDLKPQNLLFLKNYSIKLIDFGQAFNPLVPYGDSTPAYTYPYGCPQIAQQNTSFSDKSDVFSFGVILYELLYGKDIITTNPETLLKQYITKDFSKRIFFNPQQLQNYGQNFILPMLNNLIIKSLSPDLQSRPSMTWISVLMKNYLELLN